MKSLRKKPPKSFEFFLRIISGPEERFSVVGDFEEIYNDIVVKKGIFTALHFFFANIFFYSKKFYHKI